MSNCAAPASASSATTAAVIYQRRHRRAASWVVWILLLTLSFLSVCTTAFLRGWYLRPPHKHGGECNDDVRHLTGCTVVRDARRSGPFNPSVVELPTADTNTHCRRREMLICRRTASSWHSLPDRFAYQFLQWLGVLTNCVPQWGSIEFLCSSSSSSSDRGGDNSAPAAAAAAALLPLRTLYRDTSGQSRESSTALEDCRAFTFDGDVFMIGTTYMPGTNSNVPTLVKLQLNNGGGDPVIEWQRQLSVYAPWHTGRRHKNWVHVPHDTHLLLHTDSWPSLNVVRVDIATMTAHPWCQFNMTATPTLTALLQRNGNAALRGTSNWCRLSDTELVCMLHFSVNRKSSWQQSYYRHLLMACDRQTLRPTRHSDPLCLCSGDSHDCIQFCSHMSSSPNGQITIGLGVDDRGYLLQQCNAGAVDALLCHPMVFDDLRS